MVVVVAAEDVTVGGGVWCRGSVEVVAGSVAPPRASMMRQRARYSSSVVGFSKRERFERLRFVHESRQWRLASSNWN